MCLDRYRWDFPGGASGKEPACQFRRRKRGGFDPQIRKTPWRRAWENTPVFLLGKIPWTEEPVHGISESQTQLKQLITHA